MKRPGRKSAAQTPAKKSDRFFGSRINPKGSASSKSNSITFSDTLTSKIKSAIKKHNEKFPSKKVSLPIAKAVVRRGMGAFSVTHRHGMTRTQWGLARLNTFLKKKSGGKVKVSYVQDDDLM